MKPGDRVVLTCILLDDEREKMRGTLYPGTKGRVITVVPVSQALVATVVFDGESAHRCCNVDRLRVVSIIDRLGSLSHEAP